MTRFSQLKLTNKQMTKLLADDRRYKFFKEKPSIALDCMDSLNNLTDNFVDQLGLLFKQMQESLKFACYREKWELLHDLGVDDKKRQAYDNRILYAFDRKICSTIISKNWITDETLATMLDTKYVGYRYLISMDMRRDKINFKVIRYCRFLVDPNVMYPASFDCKFDEYETEKDLFKYYKKCLEEYLSDGDIKLAFKEQGFYMLGVSFADFLEKVNNDEITIQKRYDETSINNETTRKNLVKLFKTMLEKAQLDLPIEMFQILDSNVSTFIGNYLIRDKEKERRFKVDAVIDFSVNLSVTRYLRKVRPLHVCPIYFGDFGGPDIYDEWKFVMATVLEDECEFLQANDFRKAEPLKFLTFPERLPIMLAARIMRTEAYKREHDESDELKISFEDFKALTGKECINPQCLFTPELFKELKDEIVTYGQFLIRRSALLIATILMMSIEDYFLTEIQPRYKAILARTKKDPNYIPCRIRVGYEDPHLFDLYQFKEQLHYYVDWIPRRFYRKEAFEEDLRDIRLTLDYHKDLLATGNCSNSMFLRLDVEKAIEAEKKKNQPKKRYY